MDIVGAVTEGAQMEPGYGQGAAANRIARELQTGDLPQLLALLRHEDERVAHMTAAVLMSNDLVQMLQDPDLFCSVMNALLDALDRDSELVMVQVVTTLEACAMVAPRERVSAFQGLNLQARLRQAAAAAKRDDCRDLLERALHHIRPS